MMKEKQKLAVAKTTEEIAEEQHESYLKYIMKDNEITIHVYDGGQVIFQSGLPKDPPPY